jgi:hypothetical protein
MVETIMEPEGSPKGELSYLDIQKILVGASIAFGSCAAVQLLEYLTTGVMFDLAIWSTGFIAVMINVARKYLTDTNK